MSIYTTYKKTIEHLKKNWYKYGIGAVLGFSLVTLCNYKGIGCKPSKEPEKETVIGVQPAKDSTKGLEEITFGTFQYEGAGGQGTGQGYGTEKNRIDKTGKGQGQGQY